MWMCEYAIKWRFTFSIGITIFQTKRNREQWKYLCYGKDTTHSNSNKDIDLHHLRCLFIYLLSHNASNISFFFWLFSSWIFIDRMNCLAFRFFLLPLHFSLLCIYLIIPSYIPIQTHFIFTLLLPHHIKPKSKLFSFNKRQNSTPAVNDK